MNLKISKYHSYLQLTACFAFLAMALLGGGKIMAQVRAGGQPCSMWWILEMDGLIIPRYCSSTLYKAEFLKPLAPARIRTWRCLPMEPACM